MSLVSLATSEAARFLRFALVGGIGFVIDAGLLALLHYGVGLDPYSSRLISISASAFTTWRLNRSLTFGASDRSQANEGLRYALVAAATAGFNYAVYAALLLAFSALAPIAAAVVATCAAMFFSYAGYSRLVFQGARATLGERGSQRR
jgi:putative flippase GtrA